ncbi:MAG: hypothetical protein SF182_08540 [Deltaproteobacteria bacterium]|nr:hypothetical protein [Deltaproteobacteria bacterium]
MAYYLPTSPSLNTLGDIHARWSNELASVGLATALLPLIPAFAVARNRKANYPYLDSSSQGSNRD